MISLTLFGIGIIIFSLGILGFHLSRIEKKIDRIIGGKQNGINGLEKH